MIRNYIYLILLALFFIPAVQAQDGRQMSKIQDSAIEGLNFYPNPVSNGKIYITSKSSLDKEVTIFDVLGKKVLQTVVNSKEMNISNLSPGVYIIKIREDESTATRKLIVK
ncbi:MAG TPA: T9SS type A sorting domain-containing protein [Flavobacterium sp.]|jgi:hypothetical protein